MMNIDKKELKIISMEFRTVANRLITCNYYTGMDLLKKFIAYIDGNEITNQRSVPLRNNFLGLLNALYSVIKFEKNMQEILSQIN